MNAWLLVALIVASTTVGDILQSHEMKRHGEIDNLSPRGIAGHMSALARRPLLAYAFLCMAISFFSFMLLLSVADLSFAVPATAASYVLETVLAKLILKERIDYRRWAGAVLVTAGVALLAV